MSKLIPTYISNYCDSLFNELLNELEWVSTGAPRDEYFMSLVPLEYTYGRGRGERTYTSREFSDSVKNLMDKLNSDFSCEYNVCFLNYYDSKSKWLGWHADDSVEMDTTHPIAVISFGSCREIYWKPNDFKGEVPLENRKLLEDGSLFIMPAHFQEGHLHKIPKNGSECGGRISLTFRRYV